MKTFTMCCLILVCILVIGNTTYAQSDQDKAKIIVQVSQAIGIAVACQLDEDSIVAEKARLIRYILKHSPIDSAEEVMTIASDTIWEETITQRGNITAAECRKFAKVWYSYYDDE